MAFDIYFTDRIRQILNASHVVYEEKKMMGGLIFMVNGKMCIGADQDKETGEDRLMARIGKEFYQHALQEAGARQMDFTGRIMRGFVFIYPDGTDSDVNLSFWIKKALSYNKLILNN